MRVDNGEWVYGYYVVTPNGQHRIYWKPFEDATQNTYHKVKPETIGQYTGMNDMHDVKIFEHDLLETGHYVGLRQVEFISMMFQVHTVPLIKYRIGYCVVKGNIHTP